MFISFGNEVFERNQNKLLKSKIDDLLKQKEIYQRNEYHQIFLLIYYLYFQSVYLSIQQPSLTYVTPAYQLNRLISSFYTNFNLFVTKNKAFYIIF